MIVRRLRLRNFRGVSIGEVRFAGHTVVAGGNSVGKSTICEALDLLLGPDRLSRAAAIDEHDFFKRRYLDDIGKPIPIKLEVVLTDLTAELERKYKAHREYWNTDRRKLLDESATPDDTDTASVIPALRVEFEGIYDPEEDEFRAETFFPVRLLKSLNVAPESPAPISGSSDLFTCARFALAPAR